MTEHKKIFFRLCTIALGPIFGLASSLCMADKDWKNYQLSEKDVLQIEANIRSLPEGRSIKKYNRYYAGRMENGHYIVTAVYLAREKGRTIIVPFKDLPLVDDGGCDVISLKYNLQNNLVLSLTCNGSA